jgi:hypothetical protein
MRVSLNGQRCSTQVFLYHYDDLTAPYRWGTTTTIDTANFRCDIDDSSTTVESPTWPPITSGNYYVRIGTRYAYILIPQSQSNADFTIEFDGTNFTVYSNGRGITLYSTSTWTATDVARSINQTP